MIRRKIILALISLLTAFTVISCGGAGAGDSAGEGGPDVSPENIADAGTLPGAINPYSADTVADSTSNDDLTGTTAATGEIIIEPEVNVTIEGEVDTGTTTGTTTATGDTDNPGVDTEGSITNNTETETLTEDAAAILPIETGETDAEQGVSETETDDGVTDGTAGGIADSGAGSTVEDLENDEIDDLGKLAYTLDSSLGKWYEVPEKDLISESEYASIKAQIEQLRKAIKAARDEYKDIVKQISDAEKTPPGLAKKEDLPPGQAKKDNTAKNLEELKAKQSEYAVKIRAIRKQIAELRAKIGNGGRTAGGIVTYWAKQNLFLNISKGEPGWYRLVIVAKNQGVLPDDYDRFSFSVEQNGDPVASISVKASDKVYNRGSAIFKLDNPAGTQLNILWTNDAYLKGVYDANVNIRKVALIKIDDPSQKLSGNKRLKGDQYSFIDGRWFFDKNEAYTFWANQVIGYTFKNMEEGQYEVTIQARNHGTLPLPKDYREFQVEVDSEYDSASIAIKASDKGWQKEKFTINLPEGDTTLYFTWINDSYREGEYDANIKIKSIHIKKVKQSDLTAYLLKTKPGNRVFVLSAFLMISAVLLGIYMKNRKSEASSL